MTRPIATSSAAAWLACAVLLAASTGCGGSDDDAPAAAHPEREPADRPHAPETAAEPELLPRPFTAEQIRDAWVEGLTLEIARSGPAGETVERWTVVGADADGAEIRYETLGGEATEPRVERTAWTELRDHASFPVDRATRHEATRDTALGTFEGWVYEVDDPDAGTHSELFFATALPGAPLEVRMTRGDEVLLDMRQTARSSPAD